MKPFSVAVTVKNHDGESTRSVLWVEAASVSEAYAVARQMMPEAKLGALLPGHHAGVF